MLDDAVRCLLIGGTSNVGKSTLAAAYGAAFGWPVMSTDHLSRHPGRPWPTPDRPVPPHVAEHYGALSPDALIESVLSHYRSMWPRAERLVRAHAAAPLGRLVLEGSGCWPDDVVTLELPQVAAIWLTGTDDLIATRIRRESRYDDADAPGRHLIEKFIARSQRYNTLLLERLTALGLPAVPVTDQQDIPALLAACEAQAVPLTRT
jgi:hypothetical protein